VTDPLSVDAVAAVDSTNLVADVLDLPSQLRDALWRVESAMLEPIDAPGGLVVAGMGGSAIGGALARAALGDQASRPIVVTRSYGLPAWTSPEVTVLCSSYSGNTEETLASYDAAGALGARRIVVTTGGRLAEAAREDRVPVIPLPGGLQPRGAVAYMTVAAMEVAALCGVGPELRSEVDVAAAQMEGLTDKWGPSGADNALAKRLARGLDGTITVIAGAGPTIPVAYRWKTQLNENAKVPAFWSSLPEADHNEVCGWERASELGRFHSVFLDDPDADARTRARIDPTARIAEPSARVNPVGDNSVERTLGLVLLGDLVSVYLAVLDGVDPTPIAAIERVKGELGG
jgi:glucose/mannose-6-phosphate isomerase